MMLAWPSLDAAAPCMHALQLYKFSSSDSHFYVSMEAFQQR